MSGDHDMLRLFPRHFGKSTTYSKETSSATLNSLSECAPAVTDTSVGEDPARIRKNKQEYK